MRQINMLKNSVIAISSGRALAAMPDPLSAEFA